MSLRTIIDHRPENNDYIDFTLLNMAQSDPDASWGYEEIARCTIKILENRREMARMYNVWVQDRFRGNSLGKTWLGMILDWCATRAGLQVIRCKVQRSNRAAIALYDRLRFRPVGTYIHDDKIKLSLRLVGNDRKLHPNTNWTTQMLQWALVWNDRYDSYQLDSMYFNQLRNAQNALQQQSPRQQRPQAQRFDARRYWSNILVDNNDNIIEEHADEPYVIPETITYQMRADFNNDWATSAITMDWGDLSNFKPKKKEKVPRQPDLFDNVEFDKKFKLPGTPHPMLTAVGVAQLMKWMSNYLSVEMTYTDINNFVGLESVRRDHSFEWRDEEYDAGGRFIQRLAKVLSVTRRVKLDDDQRQEIGNLLNNHWIGGDSDFYFDVVGCVNWESGAFGEKDQSDGGSCWWFHGGLNSKKSRVSIFNSVMPEEAVAIRLWTKTDDDAYAGVGRVWALRTTEGYPILFNSYGFNSPLIWAAKLQKYFGFEHYSEVHLSLSDGQRQVDFPVNNNMGILIAHPSDWTQFSYQIAIRE